MKRFCFIICLLSCSCMAYIGPDKNMRNELEKAKLEWEFKQFNQNKVDSLITEINNLDELRRRIITFAKQDTAFEAKLKRLGIIIQE